MLNEQSVYLTAETGDEAIEKIKEVLTEKLGWTAEGEYAYYDKEKSTGLSFEVSSSALSIKGYNGYGVTGAKTTAWAKFYVYWHVSEDEKTTYVSIGDSGFIFAEDENGKLYIFASVSSGNVQALPEGHSAYDNMTIRGNVAERFRYSVQKMPSYLFGGVFESLYSVQTVPYGQLRNQLVSMKGKVYRFIYLSGVNYPMFAFPVGNQEE